MARVGQGCLRRASKAVLRNRRRSSRAKAQGARRWRTRSGMRGSTGPTVQPRRGPVGRQRQRGNAASNRVDGARRNGDGHGERVEFVCVEGNDQATERSSVGNARSGRCGDDRGASRERASSKSLSRSRLAIWLATSECKASSPGMYSSGISTNPVGGALPRWRSVDLTGSPLDRYLTEESGSGLRNAVQNTRSKRLPDAAT